VAAGLETSGDDGESHANSKGPADFEKGAECGDAEVAVALERERGDRGDAREVVEKYTCSFGHVFSEYLGAFCFKIKFALGDSF
jgi:hypothetical protein